MRPYSASKLLVINLNSWMASRLNVPNSELPVVEMSLDVMLSMVMLLARPREPFELKLPVPRNGLSLVTGTIPGERVARATGLRPWFGRSRAV